MPFLHELRPHVAGDLRADLTSRTLYSTDASLYQVMPLGVLIPRHADDIQAAVELAAKHKLPVLPRAGGSSLAGQAVNAALVIDTSRHLDQVLEVNVEERWVRVQPGIVLDALNAAVRLARAAVWPGSGLQQPRLSGRDRLQQRHGQPFDPLWDERGPCAGHDGGAK